MRQEKTIGFTVRTPECLYLLYNNVNQATFVPALSKESIFPTREVAQLLADKAKEQGYNCNVFPAKSIVITIYDTGEANAPSTTL